MLFKVSLSHDSLELYASSETQSLAASFSNAQKDIVCRVQFEMEHADSNKQRVRAKEFLESYNLSIV